MKNKFLISILVCVLIITSFSGCKKTDAKTDTSSSQASTEEESEVQKYRIGICLSEDSEYYNYINTGFCDALSDTFPGQNISYEIQTISPENSGESIMQYFLGNNVDLIFADGSAALSAASIATFDTPIVAAGVIDYKTTLHLIGKSWNRKTGRNITGISGAPSVSSQLSMLLETKPDIKRIGILYSVEDTDSVYQNELLENYLDEAGIPWKEYKLTSTTVSDSQYELEEDSAAIILPGEIATFSSKEGSNLPADTFGETSLIDGILSPNSARVPKTSQRWEASFEIAPLEEAEDTQEDAATRKAKEKADKDLSDTQKENKAAVEEACKECDALYISAESSLDDQIEMITSLANESKVLSFGGDMKTGAYTLLTLYTDPYDMGYRAGKMVNRILVNEEEPGEIKISLPSSNNTKLYQDEVAQIFELTFPKSFREYDEFVESYEVGSNTNRVATEEDEED